MRAVWVTILTLCLASCGISTDDEPRDIADRGQESIDTASATAAGATTGSARIYLLSSEIAGQSRTIEPVARNVRNNAPDLFEALLSGPNTTELDQQLRTAIPAGTRLLGTRNADGVLTIDLSDEIELVTGDVLKQAIGQIVFTALELPGVTAVRITVNGRSKQWPGADGVLQNLPLTSFEYPGLERTTQPAFPPAPSQ
jgi:spore germination protein GerM